MDVQVVIVIVMLGVSRFILMTSLGLGQSYLLAK